MSPFHFGARGNLRLSGLKPPLNSIARMVTTHRKPSPVTFDKARAELDAFSARQFALLVLTGSKRLVGGPHIHGTAGRSPVKSPRLRRALVGGPPRINFHRSKPESDRSVQSILERLGIPRKKGASGFHTFRHSAASTVNEQTVLDGMSSDHRRRTKLLVIRSDHLDRRGRPARRKVARARGYASQYFGHHGRKRLPQVGVSCVIVEIHL